MLGFMLVQSALALHRSLGDERTSAMLALACLAQNQLLAFEAAYMRLWCRNIEVLAAARKDKHKNQPDKWG